MRFGTSLLVVGLLFAMAGPATAHWDPSQPAKWVQKPDLRYQLGLDVNATAPYILADDFPCEVTGPITDIHIWTSWYQDYLPLGSEWNVDFLLSIHDDIPADPDAGIYYSRPGQLLWERYVPAGEFEVQLWADLLYEGWLEPPDFYEPFGDRMCWQYNFFFDPAGPDLFIQEGTPDQRRVYWLDVRAFPHDTMAYLGWKTSFQHWNDDAVWDYGTALPRDWQELRYPQGHPLEPNSIDLAFVITGEEEPTEYKWSQPPTVNPQYPDYFYGWNEKSIYDGNQIVADDWPCRDDRPITDVHWWGSYIPWEGTAPPPEGPVGFHIGIWTDVPATPTFWSRPREMIWEWWVDMTEVNERVVGTDFHPDYGFETCFKYDYIIPQSQWFYQEPSLEQIYWISIAAVYPPCPCNADFDGDGDVDASDQVFFASCFGTQPLPGDPCRKADLNCDGWVNLGDQMIFACQFAAGWPDPNCCVGVGTIQPEYPWGWKTRQPHWNDDAVRIFDPTAPIPGSLFTSGEPIENWEGSWDMAFVLTSVPPEELDFGDAPEPPYPTTLALDGARHVIVRPVFLGVTVDPEPDGQPDPLALGDDNDGNDDEDGVAFLTWPLRPGQLAAVDVTANANGMLDAWVDFGADGSWAEAGDQIFNSVALAGPATTTLTFLVPGTAVPGTTFARFRFSTAGGLSYVGQAPDGEVEDCDVWIEERIEPMEFEYSLDIGSDHELSDIQMDGDEWFDPGDVYDKWGAWSCRPENGFKDDLSIFGQDPWPIPLLSGTEVPIGTGTVQLYPYYFDLDGHDQTDFVLVYPYDAPIIMTQPSGCVYEPRYLYWSYDDDMAPGWCAPVPPGGDVPVTAPSPAGLIYGTTAMADEVIGATVVPAVPSAIVTGPFGVASELMVAIRLLANPDLTKAEDDDVDSLDAYAMQPTGESCPYWYFTADHEARWGPPGGPGPLDPGDIYLANPPLVAGPVLAVDNSQLGVPDGTDVDAFEFVVLPMPDYPGVLALAVLFSVDDDDPLTLLVNESGGLNPNAVYVSFLAPMAGPPQEFLVLDDDVDALTVYPQEPIKAPNLIPNVVGNIYPPEPWPDSTLPKEISNVIYLVFDESIAVAAAPPVTIQQLLQSCPELLGPDVAANFTYTVLTTYQANDTIKCKENGAVLANQTWYRVKPTASLTSVAGVPCNPFVLDLVTLQGDANNSSRVTTADYTTVKNHMNERTDNRYDLNGSERITTADYTVVKNHMNERAPAKP